MQSARGVSPYEYMGGSVNSSVQPAAEWRENGGGVGTLRGSVQYDEVTPREYEDILKNPHLEPEQKAELIKMRAEQEREELDREFNEYRKRQINGVLI